MSCPSKIWTAVLSTVLLVSMGCGFPSIPSQGDAVRHQADAPSPPFLTDVPAKTGFELLAVDPNHGPTEGGTRVTITGQGFEQGARVFFGGSEASDVVVESETRVKATAPPHTPGYVPVRVVLPDGAYTELAKGFYYEAEIAVSSVTPDSGPVFGGIPVTITGKILHLATNVAFGTSLVPSMHVQGQDSLVAVLPPGQPGPADVTVFTPVGAASLRAAFDYAPPPEVELCDPAALLLGQETTVTVTGEKLAPLSMVEVTGAQTELLEATGDRLRLLVRPTQNGPLDVLVHTAGGHARARGCMHALQGFGKEPKVIAISPNAADASGGGRATLIVGGDWEGATPSDFTVWLGGTMAGLVYASPLKHQVGIVVPPGTPGSVVDVTLEALGVESTLPQAFTYLEEVRIGGLVPDHGPAGGFTEAELKGQGLSRVVQVFVGGKLAKRVSKTRVSVPPGNPGNADLWAVLDDGTAVGLEDAFLYETQDERPKALGLVPQSGSQAGGTVVHILGVGLDAVQEVLFGGKQATILSRADPADVSVLTPRGDPGAVDVELEFADQSSIALPRAFVYFDPTGYFGGIWGAPISGSVNVTVLDQDTSLPVENALTLLSRSGKLMAYGFTDDRGQITFSFEGLRAPVDVTGTREDYGAITLAAVPNENVTLFIRTAVPSQGGGGGVGTALSDGLLWGRVTGADKHVLAPPLPCQGQPLVFGDQCKPCRGQEDCGSDTFCARVPAGGFHCVKGCGSKEDCPPGHGCYQLDGHVWGCLPSPGEVSLRCGTSAGSLFSEGGDQGPVWLATQEGRFALKASPGESAVYCLGGVLDSSGDFVPMVMGLKRHVRVYAGQSADLGDIPLDIPLDQALHVSVMSAPSGPSWDGTIRVSLAVELGSDGVLRLWDDFESSGENRFVFTHLPDFAHPALDGAELVVRAQARRSGTDWLESTSTIHRAISLSGAPKVFRMLVGEEGQPAEASGYDFALATAAVCRAPYWQKGGRGGVVLAANGASYLVDPQGGLTALPGSPGPGGLSACSLLPDGGFVAVGERGSLTEWRRDSTDEWEVESIPSGSSLDLVDVVVLQDGSAAALTRHAVVMDLLEAPRTVGVSGAVRLRALCPFADGSLLVAGDSGFLATVTGEHVSPVLPLPTPSDLLACTHWKGGVVVVGEGGVLLQVHSGAAHSKYPLAEGADLTTVAAVNNGKSLLVGGMVDGHAVVFAGTPAAMQRIDLDQPDARTAGFVELQDSVLVFTSHAVVLGPMLQIPHIYEPRRGLPWGGTVVTFEQETPPAPSISYLWLRAHKSLKEWEILFPGDLHTLLLPPLAQFPAFDPLHPGKLRLYLMQVRAPGFSYGDFDYPGLSFSNWDDWVVVQYPFLKP